MNLKINRTIEQQISALAMVNTIKLFMQINTEEFKGK